MIMVSLLDFSCHYPPPETPLSLSPSLLFSQSLFDEISEGRNLSWLALIREAKLPHFCDV